MAQAKHKKPELRSGEVAALLAQLEAGDIPPESRPVLKEVLKSDYDLLKELEERQISIERLKRRSVPANIPKSKRARSVRDAAGAGCEDKNRRSRSAFFRTQRGARVGDTWMSLIQTAASAGVNPFAYLTLLQDKAPALRAAPQDFLPWNAN